ncbi:MAG: hypothetical protein GX153_04665 [Clostridiaceae bacterium]|nr:hypothetical protein [Clostridiaceae bacterium]
MTSRSVRQVARAPKTTPRYVRILAALLTVIALAVVAVAASSLLAARKLMGAPKKALGSYSSTIMPPFSLAGFRSLDGQTQLVGWLFQPESESHGTVVMVHAAGANRLQFDADTLMLYDFFIKRGYGVLSFDLSHAGESDGEFTTYGYNEWEDVIAALDYAWRNSVSDHLLLFGWGTGCAASLLAVNHIPVPGVDRQTILPGDDSERARMLRELPFDRDDIKAVMLDGVAASPDAYIRAGLTDSAIDRILMRKTVPVAVRLSSRSEGKTSLIPILSQVQWPVYLVGTEGPDATSGPGVEVLLEERMRLHPDSTMHFPAEGSGFLESFPDDPDTYLARLSDFFRRFLDPEAS